jgi:hypothetical protein
MYKNWNDKVSIEDIYTKYTKYKETKCLTRATPIYFLLSPCDESWTPSKGLVLELLNTLSDEMKKDYADFLVGLYTLHVTRQNKDELWGNLSGFTNSYINSTKKNAAEMIKNVNDQTSSYLLAQESKKYILKLCNNEINRLNTTPQIIERLCKEVSNKNSHMKNSMEKQRDKLLSISVKDVFDKSLSTININSFSILTQLDKKIQFWNSVTKSNVLQEEDFQNKIKSIFFKKVQGLKKELHVKNMWTALCEKLVLNPSYLFLVEALEEIYSLHEDNNKFQELVLNNHLNLVQISNDLESKDLKKLSFFIKADKSEHEIKDFIEEIPFIKLVFDMIKIYEFNRELSKVSFDKLKLRISSFFPEQNEKTLLNSHVVSTSFEGTKMCFVIQESNSVKKDNIQKVLINLVLDILKDEPITYNKYDAQLEEKIINNMINVPILKKNKIVKF